MTDLLVTQTRRQPTRLLATFIGKRHVRLAGESIFGRQRRCAMPHEETRVSSKSAPMTVDDKNAPLDAILRRCRDLCRRAPGSCAGRKATLQQITAGRRFPVDHFAGHENARHLRNIKFGIQFIPPHAAG